MERSVPETLAIIPARSGSKGLPGKNIKPLMGKPLLTWSIEQATAASRVTAVHVSTDSQEIADIASASGADVPYLRPPGLATDSASTSAVMHFALDYYSNEVGRDFDYVVLLEPTSPLRREGDIDAVLHLLHDSSDTFDSVITLAQMTAHPSTAKCIDSEGYVVPFCRERASNARRQELDPALYPYVIAHAAKVSAFRLFDTLYTPRSGGYLLERWQAFEIDDYVDFLCVETVLRHRAELS